MTLDKILDNLNDEQLKVVREDIGPVLVLAGAGSGKTTVLTRRIAYMIQEMNIKPREIVAMTFTNKASNTMKERLYSILGDAALEVNFHTFHSFALRILFEYIDRVDIGYNKNFSIYDEDDKKKIVKNIIDEIIDEEKSFKYSHKILFDIISHAKCNNITEDRFNEIYKPLICGDVSIEDDDSDGDIEAIDEKSTIASNAFDEIVETYKQCYIKYNQILLKNNGMDFDDLIINLKTLLSLTDDQGDEYILREVRSKYKHFLVDEYQDTSALQFQILELLCMKKDGMMGNESVFVVGDDDQSIYSWRGARIENIFDFKAKFKKPRIHKLVVNYRSYQAILDVANQLIENNHSNGVYVETKKKLVAAKKEKSEKPRVVYKSHIDYHSQAEFILENIQILKRKGINANEIAVLARTKNSLMTLENILASRGVPYVFFGGIRLNKRIEIKYVNTLIYLFLNPYDTNLVERLLTDIPGLGAKTFAKVIKYLEMEGITILDMLLDFDKHKHIFKKSVHSDLNDFANYIVRLNESYIAFLANNDIATFLAEFLDTFAYIRFIKLTNKDISVVINRINSYITGMIKDIKSNSELDLVSYIRTKLIDSTDEDVNVNNAVVLSTIHGVKGLEYKYVFIIGLEDGTFPNLKPGLAEVLDGGGIENKLMEERRLLYVAVTRAKSCLFLMRSETSKYNYASRVEPSIFLNEIKSKIKEKVVNITNPLLQYNSSENRTTTLTVDKARLDLYLKKEEAKKNAVSKFVVGQKVKHKKFGMGTIQKIAGSNGVILFDDVGEKTINLIMSVLEIVK